MIVVGIVAILAAIAIPLHSSMQGRARIAKSQADVRALGSAITTYAAHTGAIPTSAANMSAGLTTSTTVGGVAAGPFLASIPSAPSGGAPAWAAYAYSSNVAPGGVAVTGAFIVCSSGDGTYANSGGVASCP